MTSDQPDDLRAKLTAFADLVERFKSELGRLECLLPSEDRSIFDVVRRTSEQLRGEVTAAARLVGCPEAWHDRAQLDGLLSEIELRKGADARRRARLTKLVRDIEASHEPAGVTNRSRRRLHETRQAAASELISAIGDGRELPGPDATDWVGAFLAQTVSDREKTLEGLERGFPALTAHLEHLELVRGAEAVVGATGSVRPSPALAPHEGGATTEQPRTTTTAAAAPPHTALPHGLSAVVPSQAPAELAADASVADPSQLSHLSQARAAAASHSPSAPPPPIPAMLLPAAPPAAVPSEPFAVNPPAPPTAEPPAAIPQPPPTAVPPERSTAKTPPQSLAAAHSEPSVASPSQPTAAVTSEHSLVSASPLAAAPPERAPLPPPAAMPREGSPHAPSGRSDDVSGLGPEPAPPLRQARETNEGAQVTEPESRPRLPTLRAELRSLEQFAREYWIDERGSCERAPWAQPSFGSLISSAALDACQARSFLTLWVYSRAAEVLGIPVVFDSADVRALATVWRKPGSRSAGRDTDRNELLRISAMEPGSPRLRTKLVLAAIRPGAIPVPANEVPTLIGEARFTEPALASVISGLLVLAAHGLEPTEHIQPLVEQRSAPSKEELAKRLTAARDELDRAFRAVCNPGGMLKTTHSREAWSRFIMVVEPVLRPLHPVGKGGAQSWSPAALQPKLDALQQVHEQIADEGGVGRGDRSRANRAAERLQETAQSVNRAMRAIKEASAASPQHPGDKELVAAIDALKRNPPPVSPDEELLRELTLRALEPGAGSGSEGSDPSEPLSISAADICRWPGLLNLLAEVDTAALVQAPGVGEAGSALALRDLPQAAALFLRNPPKAVEDTRRPIDTLCEQLQESGRPDLLVRLVEALPRQTRHRARQQFFELDAEIQARLERVRARGRSLQRCGECDAADELQAAVDSAPSSDSVPTDSLLRRAWVGRLDLDSKAIEQAAVAALQAEIAAAPEAVRDDAERALKLGAFDDVVRLMREGAETTERAPMRETLWRDVARRTWPEPMRALAQRFEDEPTRELVEFWLSPYSSATRYQALALRFAKFVCSEQQGRQRATGSLYDKDGCYQQARGTYSFPAGRLREWFTEKKLNPCFIPQLGRFKSVTVLALSSPPTHTNFAEFVAQQSAQHAMEHGLCVILAPQLSRQRRDDAHRLLHNRGLAAALLDDLDLCRLIAPGQNAPNLLVGLLEIVLEQLPLPLPLVSPYQKADGQHVNLEMFVGRRDVAQDLVLAPGNNRLFSGRKLGKSALLTFIRQTWDGKQLPSGNTMRVVDVRVVGTRNETRVVAEIARSIHEKLGYRGVLSTSSGVEPGDQLLDYLRGLWSELPDVSLLLILDEADVFVESQIEEFENRTESCLSFKMRSALEAERDSKGCQRVRFILAGYRVVNTHEGTWANWGTAKSLDPLSPTDAAALVAGPFARLGIDALDQAAAIAYRCGYQPAVIIAFGDQLLSRLRSRLPIGGRERVEVTADDVQATFNDSVVQEEIKTITLSNFQGNDRGLIVFLALLAEFNERHPRAGIRNAAPLIMDRLLKCDADAAAFLTNADESSDPRVMVEQELLNFEKRRLVVGTGNGEQRQIHLRYPHHLPILTDASHGEDELRRRLTAFRGKVANSDRSPQTSARIRCLVPRGEVSELRTALWDTAWHEHLNGLLLTSLWPGCVAEPRSGFGEGLDVPRVIPVAELPGHELDELLVLQGVSPELAGQIFTARASGASGRLLPPALCTGGADLARWEIASRRDPGKTLLHLSLGRLKKPTLAWWFHEQCGLEWDPGVEDPLQDVMRLTSGVPLLVALLDSRLRVTVGEGRNVSRTQWSDLLRAYGSEDVRTAAQQLTKGGPEHALTPRELDVLRMVAVVSPDVSLDVDSQNLVLGLDEGWRDMYAASWEARFPTLPLPAPISVSTADDAAVELVLRLGLLPSAAHRAEDGLHRGQIAPLSHEDAINALLNQR